MSSTKSSLDQSRHGQRKTSNMKKADFKVVLLGDMDVGKTSLVLRYIERRFQETISTIGASFLLKQWGNYTIAIWDTAGEEKYQGLNLFYCRNTSAAILLFDLTQHKTFETLRSRYLPLLDSIEGFVLKVVVGSKQDLLGSHHRQVTQEEAIELTRSINDSYCQTNPVPYFETSSLTGRNVDKAFEAIFEYFFPKRGSQPQSNSSANLYSVKQMDHQSISLSHSTTDNSMNAFWRCCA